MEKKPSAKKLPIIAGILTLTLVAFFVGGIVLSSAHAASMGKKPGQQGTPGPANETKGDVTVNSVAGNIIKATVLELPNFPKNSAITITTTASTIYDPDKSAVAPGKTIYVVGTVNQDGSITASNIGFYDPTMVNLSGTITKIGGSTITVQAKDQTFTILVTHSTTFSKAQVDLQTHTKSSQPASFSDLAVGETIEAYGKLNSDGSLTASNVVIMPSDGGDGGTK
ncbi:MAG TPA: DUF5666 domain-containing protein [Ktedonobacteraceae bacterium]|nr:DUF5666 domain-containing protein [Ktedonobacteraceae bacterium]